MYTSAAGQRMSGKGNCCDTAALETVFKTIKLQDHQGRADLAQVIGNPQEGRDRHIPIPHRLS
jgi:hypothetical protein